MMKYYSLIDKVYRLDNLKKAYGAVKANNGAPGIDGQTVRAFGENLEAELQVLHHELKTGTYKPSPVRRVEIPKLDGSKRSLGIPTVWIPTRTLLSPGGSQSREIHEPLRAQARSRPGPLQML